MKLSSHKVAREAKLALNLTSMIDVVFLLLIYFIVTLSVTPNERELESAIKTQREQARSVSDLQPAVIEVRRVGGRAVYKIGTREIASRAELTDVLRRFENKSEGAFVRAADDVEFGHAAAAVQAAKDARFELVSYVPLSAN